MMDEEISSWEGAGEEFESFQWASSQCCQETQYCVTHKPAKIVRQPVNMGWKLEVVMVFIDT